MRHTALQRVTLLVAVITQLITAFMGASTNLALPNIGAELGMDALMLSWIASGYLLAAAIFLLPFGRLGDIYGRKRVFSIGVFAFFLGSLLAALAPSGVVLIAGRIVQGLGGGMVSGTTNAMLLTVYPPAERGRVLGWNIAAVYIGLSIGPPLGGWMVESLGWRSIFWVNSLLCGVVLILIALYLRHEWRESAHEKFDRLGAVLSALFILFLMTGFASLPGPRGYLALAAAAAALLLFLRWESKTEQPLLEVHLLHENRTFAWSNLAALINYSATFAVGFLLSLFLQSVKGLPPRQAGMVMMLQPVLMAILAPLAGHFSDRIEPRRLASAGMALTAVGLAMLCFIDARTSLVHIGLSLVVLGAGFGLFSSPNTNAIMGSVERRQYGVASAMVGIMRMLGQVFSMAMATLVIALFVGHKHIGPETQEAFTTGARLLLAAFALLSGLGIFASLARGRMHDAKPAPK